MVIIIVARFFKFFCKQTTESSINNQIHFYCKLLLCNHYYDATDINELQVSTCCFANEKLKGIEWLPILLIRELKNK